MVKQKKLSRTDILRICQTIKADVDYVKVHIGLTMGVDKSLIPRVRKASEQLENIITLI